MSETTGDGNKKPDRDEDQGQGSQGQESTFSDPTAPVWADPTAPIPAPTPPQAPSAPVQDNPPVTPAPPVAPPVSNPYAQQPGNQQPAYGQQPGSYAQQQPGQSAPTYGQQSYATGAPSETNVSAIVLTIVSAISMLGTCFIGIPSLIFGIMALTSNTSDPVGSRKKAKTGWIIYAINAGVGVLALGVIIAFIVAAGTASYDSDLGY